MSDGHSPGIYLVNATGEMSPLATEDGSGDTRLLREALAENHVLQTSLDEKYPAIETGLDIDDATLDVRFGGHCETCDTALEGVRDGSFGQLACPDCGFSIAPTMHPVVRDGAGEAPAVVEDWPASSMEFEPSGCDVRVGQAVRGRCDDCGEPLRRNVEDVQFGSADPLTCVECEYTVGWSVQWTEQDAGAQRKLATDGGVSEMPTAAPSDGEQAVYNVDLYDEMAVPAEDEACEVDAHVGRPVKVYAIGPNEDDVRKTTICPACGMAQQEVAFDDVHGLTLEGPGTCHDRVTNNPAETTYLTFPHDQSLAKAAADAGMGEFEVHGLAYTENEILAHIVESDGGDA